MQRNKPKIDLDKITEEDLLKVRVCDLPIAISGTWIEECVKDLHVELEAKGLVKFNPPCYLADEWLTPDDEPVVGIPFFLAHPTLMKLEKKMMLDIEGGTKTSCMMLLRHEAGHAINYAYKLYKRKKWKEIFGPFNREYTDTYRFRPYSKSFVRHLEHFYAQYHPDEDFTETFAVWLTPNSDWANRYKGWRALRKLTYVDKLMNEIKDKHPLVPRGEKYWEARKMRITLVNYYKKKQRFLAEDFPDFHDQNLQKMFFVPRDSSSKNIMVYKIIQKYRRHLLDQIARWSGERKYIVRDLLGRIIKRTRELKLVTQEEEALVTLKMSSYVTTLIMNYRYTGWYRGKK